MITLYTTIFILVVSFIYFELTLPRESNSYKADVKTFPADWYMVADDGTRTSIEVPSHQSVPYGEDFVIEAEIPEILEPKTYICFRGSQQTCHIYVDDVLRVTYDTDDTRFFNGNSPSSYILCELSPEDTGHMLRIVLMSNTPFTGLINEILMGDEFDIWINYIKLNAVEFGIDMFLLVLGVIVTIGGIFVHYSALRSRILELLGWIIIIAALITFTESKVRQLFLPNISTIADLSYLIISMGMMTILLFVDEVQQHRHVKLYFTMVTIVILDLIANYTMAYFEIMELFNSMWITMGLIFIMTGAIIYSSIIDVRDNEFARYSDIAFGIAFFLFFILIGNLLVNVLRVVNSIGFFIAIGMSTLLAASIHHTVQDIMDLDRDKQRATYEKELKERFFAAISHDIRTPINGVMGMDETILRESDDEHILECAHSIMGSSKMILSLVNDLLDFSKAESGKLKINPAPYSTIDMLSDSISMVDEFAREKELRFDIDIDSNLPSGLIGDDLRVRQILTNLLSNAIKYTNEGSVSLMVTMVQDDQDRSCLRITVTDTGIGIRPQDFDKLFDSFSRIDENEHKTILGTGLGLSITKQLSDLMGGHIIVQSEYGHGSTFTALIPQSIDDFSPIGDFSEARKRRDTDRHTKTDVLHAPDARILIVDDNPINLNVMKNLFKPTEIKLDLIADGEMSVDICRYKKFNLILMDHMMPGMSGIEALDAIRNDPEGLNTETPIIALTANETLGSCDMYKRYGFDGFISKPVSGVTLNRVLAKFINSH